jgi:hypothetical protein
VNRLSRACIVLGYAAVLLGALFEATFSFVHYRETDRELWINHPGALAAGLLVVVAGVALIAWAHKYEEGLDD